MSNWLLNLPVVWMGALILGATYAVTAALYLLIRALATGERARAFKAISPGMLPPLATLFALLVGFLAAQDWNYAERASTAVSHEASSLRAGVLLAGGFPGVTETRLRELVRLYNEDAVTSEWPAMAAQNATLALAPPRLAEALRLAITLRPEGDGQVEAQREMIASLQTALDARRQRIILSRSSIDWVKWTVLLAHGGLTLLTIGMIHSDNRVANRIIMTIFATGVGVSVVLIASHSGPFTGEISVPPTALLQVMPEADATAGGS